MGDCELTLRKCFIQTVDTSCFTWVSVTETLAKIHFILSLFTQYHCLVVLTMRSKKDCLCLSGCHATESVVAAEQLIALVDTVVSVAGVLAFLFCKSESSL